MGIFTKKERVDKCYWSEFPELEYMSRGDLEMFYANAKREEGDRHKIWSELHVGIFEKMSLSAGDIVIARYPFPYPFMLEVNAIFKTLQDQFGYAWNGVLALPKDIEVENMSVAEALRLAKDVLGLDVNLR